MLPALPPVEAKGLLRRDGPIWTAEGLDIQVAASNLSGLVRLDLSGSRPQVNADLESDAVDLTTLLPDSREATAETAGDELVVPDLLTER
jgi:hypothetical protein